jgi:LPS-assembly lipoprotein
LAACRSSPLLPLGELPERSERVLTVFGFATDTTITRYNLKGRVDWSLTDTESDTRIAGGTAENFTSWSATSATVAAVAAEQDAAKRLMVILADQIAAEILAASVRFTP